VPTENTITLIDPEGRPRELSEAQAVAALDTGAGWRVESDGDRRQRIAGDAREETYGGTVDQVAAGIAAGARGLTLGASDVAIDALGGGEDLRALREVNPGISVAGEIAGSLAGAVAAPGSLLARTPAGAAARLGSRIASGGKAAGVAERLAYAGAGAGVEGAIVGIGQGVSELALSENPLDWERATSVLSSNALYGGVIGAGAGVAGSALEVGFAKARKALSEYGERGAAREAPAVADDLAQMTPEELRAAKKAELARLDAERAATKGELGTARRVELDAIEEAKTTAKKELEAAKQAELATLEEARKAQRVSLADEIKAHRAAMKEEKVFLATKGAKAWEGVDDALKKEASEIGKVSLEADRTIDRMLRNPKALASRPARALDALQQQEAALEQLIGKRASLVDVFKADESGTRLRALDSAAAALERNRGLQKQLADLATPPASPTLAKLDEELVALGNRGRTSARLEEIQAGLDDLATRGRTSARLDELGAAQDALSTTRGPKGIGEQMAGGAAYSTAASLASAIPFVGPLIAPFVGAKASSIVGEKVFGRLGNATANAAARTAKAIDAFLAVTERATPAAPVLATKVLSSTSFAPGSRRARAKADKQARKRPELATLFRTRASEVWSQVAPGPDGRPKLRPEVRRAIGERLGPVAVVSPLLADRMETIAARRIEFLARKLPREPGSPLLDVGQSKWRPSEFAMRGWARYVAATEDPAGIVERMADATITPEDAEVMREVYPEQLADITRQVVAQLPTLQATLPYDRRIALSILTGVAVDRSLEPRVIARLQATFKREAGTEGGIQAPIAQPQFGSVKVHDRTASERREEGTG
jgi:hypothetical protein